MSSIDTAYKGNGSKSSVIKEKIGRIPPVLWMIIVMVAAFGTIQPSYLELSNLRNILIQSVPLFILALGQTLIVLTQGTDLSLGAQVSFTTVMWIWLANKGVSLWIGAPIVIIMTTLIGAINGTLVGKGKLMPFIATLGMQNILNSVSLLLTSGSSIYFDSDFFSRFSDGRVLFIPNPVFVAGIMFVITYILLYRTKFGTNIFGLGGNKEALALSGISPAASMIKTYAFVGLLAGVTGLLTACRVESGQPAVGTGWEFDAVAATLLGGTSMRQGKGGIGGTVFGVLLIKMLQNGLNVLGVNTLYHNAVIGIVVLVAIVLDSLIRQTKEHR